MFFVRDCTKHNDRCWSHNDNARSYDNVTLGQVVPMTRRKLGPLTRDEQKARAGAILATIPPDNDDIDQEIDMNENVTNVVRSNVAVTDSVIAEAADDEFNHNANLIATAKKSVLRRLSDIISDFSSNKKGVERDNNKSIIRDPDNNRLAIIVRAGVRPINFPEIGTHWYFDVSGQLTGAEYTKAVISALTKIRNEIELNASFAEAIVDAYVNPGIQTAKLMREVYSLWKLANALEDIQLKTAYRSDKTGYNKVVKKKASLWLEAYMARDENVEAAIRRIRADLAKKSKE